MIGHIALFTALTDPARFRIVEYLRNGESSVTDVVRASRIQQSGVSRHLGILRDAGIVTVRRDGQRRLYSLRPEPFTEAASWIDDVRATWEPRLERLENELTRRATPNSATKED
ncbi:MAG: helix-turn-helix transcriptional regulator [Sphingomonas sp.]|uniref:ArsR/SmtB family transcription factor n=1 Tax=Sphingomonas sp. TaxID=28214 RepID=UPI0017DE8165|nr:metalloregulator ArsR/SmtB family transcription factor [Sphingomonas sp.]MBA3666644.1 helix-turn-helix transcriptional regulator [Sphingomonas sp.]